MTPTDASLILKSLKETLRAQGVTYKEVARALDVSESSIKRLFTGGDFSFSRVEQICDFLEVSFFDLAQQARPDSRKNVFQLKLAQERAFVENPKLFWFFLFVLNQGSIAGIDRRFRLSHVQVQRYLLQLDTMKLLELREQNHFRLLVPRNVVWQRGGPIERWLFEEGKAAILHSRFDQEDDFFRFYFVKFTPESYFRFRSRFEALAHEILQKSLDFDILSPDARRVGVLLACKPMTLSSFSGSTRS